MKIEQSAVAMHADHRFSSEYEARLESAISFRSVYDGVAQAGELPASGAADRNTDRETRLVMMLEAFIVRLLELISGKQDSPVNDLRTPLKTQLPEDGTTRPVRALPAAVLLAAFVGTASTFLAFAVLAERRGLKSEDYPQKGIYYLGGLTEASETLTCFALMCLWPQHFALWAYGFALLCSVTITSRIVGGWHALRM